MFFVRKWEANVALIHFVFAAKALLLRAVGDCFLTLFG